MATIVVFGGTGYTGGNVVREAASRGHHVISVSRSKPTEPIEGVTYETGTVEDLAPGLIPDADAVVATLSPRGDTTGQLVELYRELARLSAEAGARYLQVCGFSSLRPAPGAPRFVEGEATRAMLVEEATSDLDWLFISPAGSYGAWAAGERTGEYRVGDDVALFDDAGESAISGADFALAVLDEIDTPTRHRTHIGIAN